MGNRMTGAVLAAALALCGAGFATSALADGDGDSLSKSLAQDLREGKISIDGDHAAVSELILKKNLPIPYSYIEQLMATPNAFGAGPACIVCHSSSDPAKSYRGLNLST